MKDDASAEAGLASSSSAASNEPRPAAWGAPLARFNQKWEALDAKLCAFVLLAEIAALAVWITLNGLGRAYTEGGSSAGIIFRGALGAIILGSIAHLFTRKYDKLNPIVVSLAVLTGFLTAKGWANVGVAYASNWLNYLQNASALMFVNGLRGLVTRFTLWVALLGGALATSKGKHINVDVLMRFLPPKSYAPVAIAGWLAAATLCFAAVVGFVDHIVITTYNVPANRPCADNKAATCETSFSEKVSEVAHATSNDFFLLGRQVSLDLKTAPRVLVGQEYNKYLTAAEWNAWMGEADWAAHFPKEAVDAQLLNPKEPNALKSPAVNVPGGTENAAGLLVRELDFVFPFGLFMIGIRFLVRVLLVLSGHVKVNPDAAHEDTDLVAAIEHVHEVKGGA